MPLSAQQVLRISWTSPFGPRDCEIYSGEVLDFKLKSERRFQKQKILAMGDSMILLADGSRVYLHQIKTIRFRKRMRLAETFGGFFMGLGFMFIVLDTANNGITGKEEIVNKEAVVISAALCGTGLLLKQLNRKRLRLKGKRTMQIIDVDYQHLSPPARGHH